MKTSAGENLFICCWLEAGPQDSGGELPGTNFQAFPAFQPGKKEECQFRSMFKELKAS